MRRILTSPSRILALLALLGLGGSLAWATVASKAGKGSCCCPPGIAGGPACCCR